MSKTVLFLITQFSICIQFTSIWSINRTLSDATISGQNGPGFDGNEGVLGIPQSSSITGISPSDCLVSYLGHYLGESYLSSGMQFVYSTAPADCAIQDTRWRSLTSLQRCSRCIIQYFKCSCLTSIISVRWSLFFAQLYGFMHPYQILITYKQLYDHASYLRVMSMF